MNKIEFYKYHGTGNDFIMIDDRAAAFDIENVRLIAAMCTRRFGVGADGLILLRDHEQYDFEMIYFNADGRQSTMCGNGGRCIVAFAHMLGIIDARCHFLAIDGPHEAEVLADGKISLHMTDVHELLPIDDQSYQLDTGSPHFVKVMVTTEGMDVDEQGSKIRYSPAYADQGINVNFVCPETAGISVFTYERGVEAETYSCGTGVTASALVMHHMNTDGYASPIDVSVKGGKLRVHFVREGRGYRNIWLEGPAELVFKAEWPCTNT